MDVTERVQDGKYLCDRCLLYHSYVTWKCWVFSSRVYLCDGCWDSFFRVIKTHPMMQRILPKKKYYFHALR